MLQFTGTNAMTNIQRALLGTGLALTVGLAAAGPATWTVTAQHAVDCAQAKLMQRTADTSDPSGLVQAGQNEVGVDDALIDEYLSFHAQVVEEGKLSLLPGLGLRTHAN
jgi:hypothetical protein